MSKPLATKVSTPLSKSWWMLETLCSSTFRLRRPHRCSIGFRSGDMLGQFINFTLSFFSKTVVILEVCLGSLSCWNTALRPSLRREGIMLCFSMSQYMSAALIQPQTMTLPPTCLTVGKTHLYLYTSPVYRHTRFDTIWTKYIFSWSHQTTWHGSSNPCL